MPDDNDFMRRCLQLASQGLGRVQPNPMVGAVLVCNDKIIGEGWHRKYGEDHAEVDAIKNVKDKSLIRNSTLYVNLEPCSHWGKTPPCVDAIIKEKIKKVVIGSIDINSKINGTGIAKLKSANIEIVLDVLKKECIDLNRRFFTYHKYHRPYIILKWAKTADGFMDINRQSSNIQQYWITNDELRAVVHKWRSEEDAIAIGYNTYINDNPQLNTRYYYGKNPLKIVLSKDPVNNNNNTDFTFISYNMEKMLLFLYEKGIESVIVEGGKKTITAFLESNLWDEARILTGEKYFGKGTKAPYLDTSNSKSVIINNNKIEYVRRHI